MPKLKPGDKAPDFTLKDVQGHDFRLHDNLGGRKIILVFFRGAWCPICNFYLTNFQLQIARFRENNTQIIALSTDTPAEAWKLQQRLNLSFTVLPGLTKQIIEAYDLFYNENFQHSEPAIFILHPDGTIAYEFVQSSSLGRPGLDDLLAIVSQII